MDGEQGWTVALQITESLPQWYHTRDMTAKSFDCCILC